MRRSLGSRPRRASLTGIAIVMALAWACGDDDASSGSTVTPDSTTSTTTQAALDPIDVTADSFDNLLQMAPVRGFFVDNLTGDLEATLAVAQNEQGGTYPVGSLLQLIPGEAMVKQPAGFSPATADWEFFELDVDSSGTSIRVQGGAEVVNRFGGSCADCHAQADPQFDFTCANDHGCDPLPLTRDLIEQFQQGDPRPRA